MKNDKRDPWYKAFSTDQNDWFDNMMWTIISLVVLGLIVWLTNDVFALY